MVHRMALMALALYKAAEFWRTTGGFKGALVKVLIKDQFTYFALSVRFFLIRNT